MVRDEYAQSPANVVRSRVDAQILGEYAQIIGFLCHNLPCAVVNWKEEMVYREGIDHFTLLTCLPIAPPKRPHRQMPLGALTGWREAENRKAEPLFS